MADTFRQAEGVEIAFEVRAPEGTSEGRIRLKGEKFRLDTEGITTWFDGRTQWTYLENSDEVNVSEPTAEELQSINPYAWLAVYKDGYTLKMGEQADPRLHKVMMTATRRGSELQWAEIRRCALRLRQACLPDGGGDRLEINKRKLELNIKKQ